jgi:hypothetical protein
MSNFLKIEIILIKTHKPLILMNLNDISLFSISLEFVMDDLYNIYYQFNHKFYKIRIYYNDVCSPCII